MRQRYDIEAREGKEGQRTGRAGEGKSVHIFRLWEGILCGGRRTRGGGRPGSQALRGAPKCGLKPG